MNNTVTNKIKPLLYLFALSPQSLKMKMVKLFFLINHYHQAKCMFFKIIIFTRVYLLDHNKYFIEFLAQNKPLLASNFDFIT